MAVASMMRVFRACPFRTVGSWATSPRGLIYGLVMAMVPWSQGKMQGISRNQPSFAKIRLESISEFRCLRTNSLLDQSREFFCQRRELIRRAGNEQGIRSKPIRASRGMRLRLNSSVKWIPKIINIMVSGADERAWLHRTAQPRMRVSSPRSNPQTRMTKPKAQRLFPGIALVETIESSACHLGSRSQYLCL